jgi:hypothetical protein
MHNLTSMNNDDTTRKVETLRLLGLSEKNLTTRLKLKAEKSGV